MAGQIKIIPNTFALDEKTNQGLVVFETVTTKTKFSVYLSESVDVSLFLRESFKRQESGFALTLKVFEALGYKLDRGAIKELEGEREEAHLVLRNEEGKLKRIKISMLELLGLWTVQNFPMFANSKFIENCRDVKVEVKETSKPLKADLYKRYGQKYLM